MYCSLLLTSEPELLRRILELTVREGDLELLKYLVSNQNVDINGKHKKCLILGGLVAMLT